MPRKPGKKKTKTKPGSSLVSSIGLKPGVASGADVMQSVSEYSALPPGSLTQDGVSVKFLEDFGMEVKGKLKKRGDFVRITCHPAGGGVRHHFGCVVGGINENALKYKSCARCGTRSYCSARCQTVDWKCLSHKLECGRRKELIELAARDAPLKSCVTGKESDERVRLLLDNADAKRSEGNVALGEGRHKAPSRPAWARPSGQSATATRRRRRAREERRRSQP